MLVTRSRDEKGMGRFQGSRLSRSTFEKGGGGECSGTDYRSVRSRNKQHRWKKVRGGGEGLYIYIYIYKAHLIIFTC